MIIEIHMLKNYPPTNLNRDDTGSPKTCFFGGVQRGRISSQCLKRSWRQSDVLRDSLDSTMLGIRTRKLPDLVGDELRKRGVSEEFILAAKHKVTGYGNDKGTENDNNRTAQIMFFSPADIQSVADTVMNAINEAGNLNAFKMMNVKDWQKKIKDTNVRPVTLDIALFGRMVTSDAFADKEAAMQVAHAISTHAVNQESDFFTAVDDLVSGTEESDSGAGMMDDIDYNSCCYYFYSCLDMDQLRENLKDTPDVAAVLDAAIPALLRAMAYSNPSGKQNTFAGHVLPELVYVETKSRKIAVSYANAFASPARIRGERDLVEDSLDKLVAEIDAVAKDFSLPVERRLWFCRKQAPSPCGAEVMHNFESLVSSVGTIVAGL